MRGEKIEQNTYSANSYLPTGGNLDSVCGQDQIAIWIENKADNKEYKDEKRQLYDIHESRDDTIICTEYTYYPYKPKNSESNAKRPSFQLEYRRRLRYYAMIAIGFTIVGIVYLLFNCVFSQFGLDLNKLYTEWTCPKCKFE